MNKQPLVSVITPMHNGSGTMETALRSVQEQTYSNWEMILVNDGSLDGSGAMADAMAETEPRLKVVHLPQNQGVAVSRNEALRRASGDYVAFLDIDDVWLPEKLEKQLDFMRERGASFSHTAYQIMNEAGKRQQRIIEVPEMLHYPETVRGNPVGCSTVMLDVTRTGRITMPLAPHDDYRTWLKLTQKGHVVHGLNQVLTLYRRSAGSLSGNKLTSAWWTWRALREHGDLGFFRSVHSFACYAVKGIRKHIL